MEINEQFQKTMKEYIISFDEIKTKFDIKEEIDHVWSGGGKYIGIVTKWKEAE